MIQQQHLRSARVENFAAGQVGKSADKETRPDRRSIGRILYRRTQNARIKSVEVATDSAQDFGCLRLYLSVASGEGYATRIQCWNPSDSHYPGKLALLPLGYVIDGKIPVTQITCKIPASAS